MSKRSIASSPAAESAPLATRKRSRRAPIPSDSPKEVIDCSNLPIQRTFFLDADFFLSTKFSWVDKLQKLEIWDLFTSAEPIYPKLVHEFYANATTSESEPFTIRSEVKGKRLLINSAVLYRVCPNSPLYINTNPNKFSEISDQFYSTYSLSKPSKKKNFSYTSLKSKARVLCYCLMRILFPGAPSKENPNNTVLKVLFDILEGYDVDVFPLIIGQIEDALKDLSAHPLPFPIILTKLFRLFKVDLDDEECSSEPPLVMNKDALEFLGFTMVGLGEWIHSSEVEKPPSPSAPFTPPPSTSTPSTDQIASLLSDLSTKLNHLGAQLKEELLGRLEETLVSRVGERLTHMLEDTLKKVGDRLSTMVETSVSRAIAKAHASDAKKGNSDQPPTQKKTSSAPAASSQPSVTSTSSQPNTRLSSPVPLNVVPLHVVHPSPSDAPDA